MSEPKPEYIADALEMIGISEPKQIITEVSGFVPIFEVVLNHYEDLITASVFGRMWQYCNMEDGVCKASLERIGKDLKISPATVMRHAEKLVNDGFLIDTTPDRRNAPHEYLDGRRVEMKGRISAGIAERKPSISQRNATVSQSQLIKQDNTILNNKPDLLDAIIHFEQKPQSIRTAIKEYFKLNVNWDTKLNRQWMEWAVSENVTPDQIKLAAEKWRTDRQFNWQVPTLKGIFEKWQMLIDSGNSNSTKTYTDEKGLPLT